jgi:hypothetical protein
MIPTGFKLYFGIAMAAAAAALVGGWSSGGDLVGPLAAGYKGGIGDWASYAILLGVALASLVVGSLLTWFRDADAEEVAKAMGTSSIPAGQAPAANSIWPIVAAIGMGAIVVGLAVSPLLVGAGLVILAMVAFEWTMTAWADRATADPAVNEKLRDQIMGPFEIPLLGLLAGGVFVLAMSRIFMAAGVTGAVVVGGIVSVAILSVGILLTQKDNLPRGLANGLVGLIAFAVLAGGVWGAIVGPAEHHSEHGDEHGEEHGEDHSDDHSEEEASS